MAIKRNTAAFSAILSVLVVVLATVFLIKSKNKVDAITVQERPPVAVETIVAASESMTESIDVVGTLAPKFQTDIKTEYSGVVKEVCVTEWVKVKKGQRLLSLDTREPDAMLSKAKASMEISRANLLEAKAAVHRAEREYNRIMKLFESGLTTQQNVDEISTQKEVAVAKLASVQAMLNGAVNDYEQAKVRYGKMAVYSPIDGVVSERKVNVGDLTSDRPLFRIVDNRILDLTVTVPSKSSRFLKPGLKLQFTTDAFPGQTFTGHVKYINPVLSDVDRSVRVVAEVMNQPEVLKGGLFVQGKIITGERKNVINVPRNSLVNWDLEAKKADVLIVDRGIAITRKVGVGTASGEFVEITNGINAGDQVICRGGYNIKDGDKLITSGGK